MIWNWSHWDQLCQNADPAGCTGLSCVIYQVLSFIFPWHFAGNVSNTYSKTIKESKRKRKRKSPEKLAQDCLFLLFTFGHTLSEILQYKWMKWSILNKRFLSQGCRLNINRTSWKSIMQTTGIIHMTAFQMHF